MHKPLILVGILLLSANSLMAETKPLKVFLLVGQSNMQGHAKVSTLQHLKMDPDSAAMLAQIQDENGTPRIHGQIPITYLSSAGEKHGKLTTGFGAGDDKIGPELMFGITMHKELGEPFLIIKCAWGGKSIHTDFRSPSAGPYVFQEHQLEQFKKQKKDINAIKADKAKATGHYYHLMIEHAKKTLADIKRVYPEYDANTGYELAGFIWFQGWNDMVARGEYPQRDKPGGYDQYSDCLQHFIRDVRKDLSAPKLPFVIGVFGVNGPVSEYAPSQKRYAPIHQNFRDAMAAPADLDEFKGNVTAVLTENYWDTELSKLRQRESAIKQQAKELQSKQKLNREQLNKAIEQSREKEFTAREREILSVAISNAEYHYLGSGKIMAKIGRGFAKATKTLMDR